MIALMTTVGLIMSISLGIWVCGMTYREYPIYSRICRKFGIIGYFSGIVITILYVTGRLAWVFNYRYFNP